MSDPRVLEMRGIIESPAGVSACIAATEQGLPALAGVEPMIIEKMSSRYGSFSQMTLTAGGIVGEVMRRQGYDIADTRGKMPPGSVAQMAACWVLRSS